MATWHFEQHQLGQSVNNPLGSVAIAAEDDDWKPGEVLVRETIQNSLDAQIEGRKVHVRIRVSASAEMTADVATRWLGDLWPHLRSRDCKFPPVPSIPEQPGPGGFVTIEDFGTRGLEGDVSQGGLADGKNRFFSFFRAEGLSGNPDDGQTGGSWGAGKSVSNRCSSINTYLGLTFRLDTQDFALLGKSLLWHHRLEGAGQFHGIGQYGKPHQTEGLLIMPSSDPALIQALVRDFRLQRNPNAPEPGFSIIIPYVDNRITGRGLVEIAIREHFFPILMDRLEVLVLGADLPTEGVLLTKETLIATAREFGLRDLAGMLELAQLSEDSCRTVVVPAGTPGAAPTWDDRIAGIPEPDRAELARAFEQGVPLLFRVPVEIQPSQGAAQTGAFSVRLQRDIAGNGYVPTYVRGWTMVPNAKRRLNKQRLFALVQVGFDQLGKTLRRAELPAHVSWTPDSDKFRGHFKNGRKLIDFVVNAPRVLVDALTRLNDDRDNTVWADFFPAPEEKDPEVPPDDAPPPPGGRKINPPGGLLPWSINRIAGGFSVTRDNADSTALPVKIVVEFAYNIGRGNAFKHYHRRDFAIEDKGGELTIGHQDITDVKGAGNRLSFRPASDEFRLRVTGFDTNRDLKIAVIAADGGQDATP
jgi:hypothetical protein